MNQSTIATIIYVLGLIFGALVLGLWDAETSPKSLIGMIWTVIFLIALFYTNRNDQE
tara:strand:+ start:111 stop:281 length:171 start_codon:yes stop_codon:yes gene_type:complete